MPTTDELAARLSNVEDRIAVLDERLSEYARGRVVALDWCYELSSDRCSCSGRPVTIPK
jgi:hypothetical protein